MSCEDQMLALLDELCPMHVRLGPRGDIRHMGATFTKLFDEGPEEGAAFLDLFDILRPRGGTDVAGMMAMSGQKLSLRLKQGSAAALKGVLLPFGEDGGALINLSFGISIMDGVRDFALTGSDFAATDLAIEMLYLIEAKSAAMEASRKLNQRLQGARIAAEEQAFTDTLTGLKNRRAVDHVLPRLIEAAEGFALMQIDLDYFKSVNDTYGHPAGDHVLQEVARILVDETRRGDCVARVGGDEFVVILEGAVDPAVLGRIAARIIGRIEEPVPWRGESCRISASIGIAIAPLGEEAQDADGGEALFDRADKALYEAKNAGRAQFRLAG